MGNLHSATQRRGSRVVPLVVCPINLWSIEKTTYNVDTLSLKNRYKANQKTLQLCLLNYNIT